MHNNLTDQEQFFLCFQNNQDPAARDEGSKLVCCGDIVMSIIISLIKFAFLEFV
jgi:hypothetical protein